MDSSADVSRFRLIVDQIAAGDPQAKHELFEILSTGVRFFLARELPRTQDVEVELGHLFRDVFEAIRRGEMREPERLLAFVLAVVRRRVAARIKEIACLHPRGLPPVGRRDAPSRFAVRAAQQNAEPCRGTANPACQETAAADHERPAVAMLAPRSRIWGAHVWERLRPSRAEARSPPRVSQSFGTRTSPSARSVMGSGSASRLRLLHMMAQPMRSSLFDSGLAPRPIL